jgi:hypothetical protein
MAGKLYHTPDAAKKFAHSIAMVLKDHQDHRILDSPWFGLGGDGSVDKSHKEKHALVVRYVDQVPAEVRWAQQKDRLQRLGKGFGKIPAPEGEMDLSLLEKLAARQAKLKKGPLWIVTEYYDLPSVKVVDSRDGQSHDSQAIVRAYGALFEKRGLRLGFNSWKEQLSNVNFDGAMMGERNGAVGEMRRTVAAGNVLIATWAQVAYVPSNYYSCCSYIYTSNYYYYY